MHETQEEQEALMRIETVLNLHGTCLSNFDLPSVLTNIMDIDNDISNDMDTLQMPENNISNTLSSRQQYVFDKIIQALENTEAHRYVFIDGPGGSGKSFLLNYIINHMDNINAKVTSVA